MYHPSYMKRHGYSRNKMASMPKANTQNYMQQKKPVSYVQQQIPATQIFTKTKNPKYQNAHLSMLMHKSTFIFIKSSHTLWIKQKKVQHPTLLMNENFQKWAVNTSIEPSKHEQNKSHPHIKHAYHTHNTHTYHTHITHISHTHAHTNEFLHS